MRLDLLLCRLRFVKTRSRARAMIEEGLIRIDGQRCDKPDASIEPGQILTLPLPSGVRVIQIDALPGSRHSARIWHSMGRPSPDLVEDLFPGVP